MGKKEFAKLECLDDLRAITPPYEPSDSYQMSVSDKSIQEEFDNPEEYKKKKKSLFKRFNKRVKLT